jgi:glycosyltransferase involved in cell wall biosynthesis
VISILLPTRRRPDNLKRLIESLNYTTSDKDTVELVIRYDADDELTRAALSELDWQRLTVQQLPKPEQYGSLWNEAYASATGEIIMICGDDIIFRTHGWNKIVEHEMSRWPDGVVIVFGQDGIQDWNIATHPFIHRKWIETVGYIGGSKKFNLHIDEWFNNISDNIGRRVYQPQIFTEHMHPSVGKATMDEVYVRPKMKDAEWYPAQEERNAEARALLAVIEEHKRNGK